MAANYKTRNAQAELRAPDSILNFYRTVLKLRRNEPALKYGDYTALNTDDPRVFSYIRKYKGEAVLVALNMSASAQTAKFDLKSQGFPNPTVKMLVASGGSAANVSAVKLAPFAVYIAKVTPGPGSTKAKSSKI